MFIAVNALQKPHSSLERFHEAVQAWLTASLFQARLWQEVDGPPPQESPVAGALLEAGFTCGGEGYFKQF